MRLAKPQHLVVLALAATLASPVFAQAPRGTPPVTQQQEIESALPAGPMPLEETDETTGRAERSQFRLPSTNSSPDACWISRENDVHEVGYWGLCREHAERSIR
jgi:hypothetical protein